MSEVDCGDKTCVECNDNAYKLNLEKKIREKIADELTQKMLPICVCERCDNLLEGRIVYEAIQIVKGGYK